MQDIWLRTLTGNICHLPRRRWAQPLVRLRCWRCIGIVHLLLSASNTMADWLENHPRGREVLDEFANTTSGKLAAA